MGLVTTGQMIDEIFSLENHHSEVQKYRSSSTYVWKDLSGLL